ncbi:unnamed protein product [Didymodactylos carnosus]|uniref:Hint domain-containing protein n=1 Tax=Didymodactylos carnosus TaxID=1234261 RepID=A0A813X224_9BILA|nr:unnamed protein product [Didymodactylos carnosus]CAF3652905.1 unnamed protein product [Didymodactylos carnosus]
MLKSVLVLLLAASTVHCVCQLEDNPKAVIGCLSNIASAFEALFTKDLTALCDTANGIASCLKPHIKECVAEQTGEQKCFSADGKVLLTNGQEKLINQLKQGDLVYAFDNKSQNIITSEIIGMLDSEPDKYGLFKSLATTNGRQLSLSSTHLIPTKADGYLMAKNLQPGMEIYVMTSDKRLTVETIVNITDVWKQGYAAPLTQSGTIIVNDVAASCYATINSHQLAHSVLAPMRWWYFLTQNTIFHADSIQNGIHWFPKMLFRITSLLLPSIIN